MARDLSAAQEFYGAVLGWTFRPATRLGKEFSVAMRDGVPIAGIGALAHTLQIAVSWTPYFAVDDADETAARIRERMGTVAVGPLAFGTGRAALAADRDGAVFGFWEGEVLPDWTATEGSSPAWIELRTRNAFDAAIFYGEVLGWAGGRPDCCEVDYEDDHVVLRQGNSIVARLSSGGVEAAPDPHVRPRWHVYFLVDDVEAAVREAERLGGSVAPTPEADAAAGRVTLRDPDGGLFTVAAHE
ncbi:VOC family protein [Streptomyces sp. NPDC051219]|uniref:VOC family protein n=1 Tax=Streptomyces sp. NPDC051219 TaxID=3155283 RepID=UPI0034282479